MMKHRYTTIAVAVCVLFVALAAGSGLHIVKPDYEAIAERLVTQSANIQEGELVLISGDVRDVELLENLAVHVRKQGAWPLVLLDTDRMTRRMFTDVPVEYDSRTPEFALKLAGLVDAFIAVESGESQDLLADIPPERFAKRGEAFEPVSSLMNERGVKFINLGNNMYPTATRAALYGMPQEELDRIFWDGVNVDYSKLNARGESIKQKLARGKELQITNPNGTDLRMRIEGRPVFVSDGMISDEEASQGGAATQVWLPAGEVFLTPVPGTAQGKVVVDRQFFQGKEIEGLTLTFDAGMLTDMTATAGLEPLKAYYDAAAEGKEQFGFIDLGINSSVPLVPNSRMQAWMPAGMVTVGIGGNVWAGGENKISFGVNSHLPGSTVMVDGVAVVENGQLRSPAM